jgi:putative endonuclease
MPPPYFVYIITNKNKTVLYTGVTNNLVLRLQQHAANVESGKRKTFTGRYACRYLVYFEEHKYILNAIAREKQIKGWTRAKKEALIRSINLGMAFLPLSC